MHIRLTHTTHSVILQVILAWRVKMGWGRVLLIAIPIALIAGLMANLEEIGRFFRWLVRPMCKQICIRNLKDIGDQGHPDDSAAQAGLGHRLILGKDEHYPGHRSSHKRGCKM